MFKQARQVMSEDELTGLGDWMSPVRRSWWPTPDRRQSLPEIDNQH